MDPKQRGGPLSIFAPLSRLARLRVPPDFLSRFQEHKALRHALTFACYACKEQERRPVRSAENTSGTSTQAITGPISRMPVRPEARHAQYRLRFSMKRPKTISPAPTAPQIFCSVW